MGNRSQGMYKVSNEGSTEKVNSSPRSWASKKFPNVNSTEHLEVGSAVGLGMTRMNSSPNSVGLEIYDDDEDSILTEESGENLTQSMQSLALTSSLDEDFLSLFAPG